jgi:hypothetical protein
MRRPACQPGGGSFNGGMVNPFAINWLWRGFRGNSVTFALLFACLVLGWSVTGSMWFFLRNMGIHWLFALVIPGLLFSWLAKREDRVIPDEAKRKLYARVLIAGSLMVALLIAWLKR